MAEEEDSGDNKDNCKNSSIMNSDSKTCCKALKWLLIKYKREELCYLLKTYSNL